MAISFSCECGQEFKVSDSHAGKRIKCQGCGNPVKIPALPVKKSKSDSGAVAAVGKGAKKKASRRSDEEDDPLVHSISDYGEDDFDFDLAKVPMGKLIEDEEGAPKKKKGKKGEGAAAEDPPKKKKKKDEDANPLLIGGFLVLALCSLGTIGYFGYQKLGGVADSTPLEKKFVVFKHDVAGWSLEHPEDWKPQASGGSGGAPPLVLFEGDGAIFRMKGSVGGSMIGTMMQPGGSAMTVPGQEPAVGSPEDETVESKIHMFQQELFKADYDQFEEERMQKIKTPFGEGRISVFTGKEGLFSGKIKGYRATFSDNNYQYNIRAYVPESQWERFEPMFKRMISSLSR
jgi:hypothetical protein